MHSTVFNYLTSKYCVDGILTSPSYVIYIVMFCVS
jgi:hypothetical protein